MVGGAAGRHTGHHAVVGRGTPSAQPLRHDERRRRHRHVGPEVPVGRSTVSAVRPRVPTSRNTSSMSAIVFANPPEVARRRRARGPASRRTSRIVSPLRSPGDDRPRSTRPPPARSACRRRPGRLTDGVALTGERPRLELARGGPQDPRGRARAAHVQVVARPAPHRERPSDRFGRRRDGDRRRRRLAPSSTSGENRSVREATNAPAPAHSEQHHHPHRDPAAAAHPAPSPVIRARSDSPKQMNDAAPNTAKGGSRRFVDAAAELARERVPDQQDHDRPEPVDVVQPVGWTPTHQQQDHTDERLQARRDLRDRQPRPEPPPGILAGQEERRERPHPPDGVDREQRVPHGGVHARHRGESTGRARPAGPRSSRARRRAARDRGRPARNLPGADEDAASGRPRARPRRR